MFVKDGQGNGKRGRRLQDCTTTYHVYLGTLGVRSFIHNVLVSMMGVIFRFSSCMNIRDLTRCFGFKYNLTFLRRGGKFTLLNGVT